MSDFKAKMHHIRFRVASAPDPQLYLRGLLLRGEERKGKGSRRKGRRGGKGRDRTEGDTPYFYLN